MLPFGVSLSPVQCIHYALTRPAVCSIECGYDTKAQVDAALAYETASAKRRTMLPCWPTRPFHSYRGEKTYCGHCKPLHGKPGYRHDQQIPTIWPPCSRKYRRVSDPTMNCWSTKPPECIGCHACEERCPFGVPIAERMEKDSRTVWVLNATECLRTDNGRRIQHYQRAFVWS